MAHPPVSAVNSSSKWPSSPPLSIHDNIVSNVFLHLVHAKFRKYFLLILHIFEWMYAYVSMHSCMYMLLWSQFVVNILYPFFIIILGSLQASLVSLHICLWILHYFFFPVLRPTGFPSTSYLQIPKYEVRPLQTRVHRKPHNLNIFL